MEPSTMMMLGNVAKGIFTIGQGIAAKKQAELDAFNIGTEKVLAKAAALMDTRRRDEALREAMAANLNFFGGVLNREITADLEASMAKDADIAGEDMDNIEFMNRLNQMKFNQEIEATKTKGRQTLLASIVEGGTAIVSGYADYKDVQAPQVRTVPRTYQSVRPRLRPTSMRT